MTEDVIKSLKENFKLTRITNGEDTTACDILILPEDLGDPDLLTRWRQKIPANRELMVVSSKVKAPEVDPNQKLLFYPYNYETISCLPIILKTIYNTTKVKA